MKHDREIYFKGVMDGSDRSVRAIALRLITRCTEPFYAGAMRARNALYDAGVFKAHDLGQPTISVGNITTGGTGKTPVVLWIARQILSGGKHPAVLLRGYRRDASGLSDEQALLQNALPEVPVIANPDRIAGAAEALKRNPATDLFILDDAMQHRRAARQINIVLISALNPFGFGHVLPRGMLREPMGGFRRADVFIITHASEMKAELPAIEARIRAFNSAAPIFKADHRVTGFRVGDGMVNPIESLREKSYFAFCGIGSPESFFSQLAPLGGKIVGSKAFADHHDYSEADVEAIKDSKADVFIVTEKDWVKLARLKIIEGMVVWRAELGLQFWEDHSERLVDMLKLPAPAPLSLRVGVRANCKRRDYTFALTPALSRREREKGRRRGKRRAATKVATKRFP